MYIYAKLILSGLVVSVIVVCVCSIYVPVCVVCFLLVYCLFNVLGICVGVMTVFSLKVIVLL